MPPKNSQKSRPDIWSDGAQNPPFQARAFALASVHFARDSLSGLLSRCSDSATGFGTQVANGAWRVPPHRLGRTGRFLPSVNATAGAIMAGATLLSRAARVVLPVAGEIADPINGATLFAPQPAAAPRPARLRPAEQPAPVAAAPVAAPASDDLDLSAIRALLADAPAAPAAAPSRSAAAFADLAPVEPALQPRAQTFAWRREWLAEHAALALGYGLLVVSVPVGAALAAIAHIKGEDLRKLVDQG